MKSWAVLLSGVKMERERSIPPPVADRLIARLRARFPEIEAD